MDESSGVLRDSSEYGRNLTKTNINEYSKDYPTTDLSYYQDGNNKAPTLNKDETNLYECNYAGNENETDEAQKYILNKTPTNNDQTEFSHNNNNNRISSIADDLLRNTSNNKEQQNDSTSSEEWLINDLKNQLINQRAERMKKFSSKLSENYLADLGKNNVVASNFGDRVETENRFKEVENQRVERMKKFGATLSENYLGDLSKRLTASTFGDRVEEENGNKEVDQLFNNYRYSVSSVCSQQKVNYLNWKFFVCIFLIKIFHNGVIQTIL